MNKYVLGCTISFSDNNFVLEIDLYQTGRNSFRSKVSALDVVTGEKLTMPQDFSKICELLPLEDWPPFAKNNLPTIAEDSHHERLF